MKQSLAKSVSNHPDLEDMLNKLFTQEGRINAITSAVLKGITQKKEYVLIAISHLWVNNNTVKAEEIARAHNYLSLAEKIKNGDVEEEMRINEKRGRFELSYVQAVKKGYHDRAAAYRYFAELSGFNFGQEESED